MATLLKDVDNSEWSLGAPRQGKYVITYPLKLGEKAAAVQLAESDSHEIATPFPPSCFQGDEGARQSITFNVPEEVFQRMATLEDSLCELLKPAHPNIRDLWHSCLKVGGQCSPQVRAKINLSGDREVQCVDESDQPIMAPTDWRGLEVVPILSLAVYCQTKTAGLIADVVALKVVGRRQQRIDWSFV